MASSTSKVPVVIISDSRGAGFQAELDMISQQIQGITDASDGASVML